MALKIFVKNFNGLETKNKKNSPKFLKKRLNFLTFLFTPFLESKLFFKYKIDLIN